MEKQEQVNFQNFTFHRHSSPKNIIYYRCSDKSCRAKLHYNTITKQIVLKNDHIDPSIHRKPKQQRVAEIQTLINHECPSEITTIPSPTQVLKDESEFRPEDEFICNEPLPQIKSEKCTIRNHDRSDDFYIIRFYVALKEDAEAVCQHITKLKMANKAMFMDQLEEVIDNELKPQKKCVVEMETTHDRVSELQTEIKSCFMIPPEILTLKAVIP